MIHDSWYLLQCTMHNSVQYCKNTIQKKKKTTKQHNKNWVIRNNQQTENAHDDCTTPRWKNTFMKYLKFEKV